MFSLAFVAAACGGGGSHGSADAVAHLGTTTSTAASGPSAGPGPGGNPAKMGGDLMKYASCMRSHGVSDFPNPIISGNSVGLEINPTIAGSPDFKTAQAACQHLLPVFKIIGLIVEDHRHRGNSEQRYGAQVGEVRKTIHL